VDVIASAAKTQPELFDPYLEDIFSNYVTIVSRTLKQAEH